MKGGILMTILDDFYYGNIRPADNEFVKNSEFDKVLKAFCSCEKELCNMLDKNDNKTLIELIKSHDELLAMTGLGSFKRGFRLGARMMCDCFVDENGVFRGISD